MTKIGNTPEIGFNKYKFLKSLPAEDLTEAEKNQVEEYEQKNAINPEALQRKKTYAEKLFSEPSTIEKQFEKKELWNLFLRTFEVVNGKPFEQTNETLENLKVIMYYFLKSEEFFKCDNLTLETKPDLKKGLLIVGSYGTGKTAIMNTFEAIFKPFTGFRFHGYNTNQLVKDYEAITGDDIDVLLSKKEFERKTITGTVLLDDLKTERPASNYGKVNLMREILELRYTKNVKTYATCNFKSGYPNDVAMAMDEFSEYYGARVYDRLFDMFNVVIFTGKSLRK